MLRLVSIPVSSKSDLRNDLVVSQCEGSDKSTHVQLMYNKSFKTLLDNAHIFKVTAKSVSKPSEHWGLASR